MSLKKLLSLWLPLAISFELMMLEGPAIQGAIGRLSNPTLNLAAFGLTMSLSLIIESPIIMILATAIALVKDSQSFVALRRFMLYLIGGCTVLTALIAFTPLFDLVALNLMGQPSSIVDAARPAMQILLFWTAAIGWRRFYQGTLVKYGQTRLVSWGTAIRLLAAVTTAVTLVRWGKISGASVGAMALMAAVITEAVATTLFSRPLVREELSHPHPAGQPVLSQKSIFKFHMPLAATTLLTLLSLPMTAAALARLPKAHDTLAAWPVASMLLLVMRGWGLALQEISVSQGGKPEAHAALRSATWLVGITTTGATALICFTPLFGFYMNEVLHAPQIVQPYVRIGVLLGLGMPLITSLGSWIRGLLVAQHRSRTIYRGMVINLSTHASLLVTGVMFQLPGMWVAAGSMTVAAVVEYVYILGQCSQSG